MLNLMAMPLVSVAFQNPRGEPLAGRLDLPAEGVPVRAYAIFAHCFTCSKGYNAPVHISRALQQQEIAVLRFDFTGLGHSEGDFDDTNFSAMVADMGAAADCLAAHYAAPQLLIGHSWGGTAVVRASQLLPTVRAVVTLGPPASPGHITHHFTGQLAEIEARHPKSFIALDGVDHLLSRKADAEYVGPLRALRFVTPPPEAQRVYRASFARTTTRYCALLHSQVRGGQMLSGATLPNTDFDTGHDTRCGEYPLADRTYGEWLRRLAKNDFAVLSGPMKQNLLGFFGETATDPVAVQSLGPDDQREIQLALGRLRAQ